MQNLKRNFILIGLIVLFGLSLSILPAQAADNDILVYYIQDSFNSKIFTTDLTNIGYNVTIIKRSGTDDMGLTPASPVNLLDYGQVWILCGFHGIAFSANEITALKTFRDAPNSGGLLLSGEDDPAHHETTNERINQIAREYNNGANMFFGDNGGDGDFCNNSVLFTWSGYPTAHPLYTGLSCLSSSNSEAELNIQNLSIEVTVKNAANSDADYGAVLDNGLGGRIIFDTSVYRFTGGNRCDSIQESLYQQNIAYWLDGVDPHDPLPPTCNLSASPNPINIGDTTTLTWTSTGADTVDSSNFGAVGVSGSATVSPTSSSTTYNLTVSGASGIGSCSAIVITTLPPISGGLIPCGRKTDNPDTPNVNEKDECTVCHFFLMIKNIMDFIAKIAVIVAILFIAIGGIMYVLSTGNEAMLSKAKAMITYAIIGFILIFAAWIIIELILSTFGYTNPLGGEWDVIC